MSTAAIVAGTVGAGVIGAVGSNMAAGKQASAADRAAQLSYQAQANSLDFQKQVYGNTQQQLAPWLQTGTNAITRLNALMGLPPNQTNAPQFAGANTNQGGTNFPNRIPSVGGWGGPGMNRLAMLDGGARDGMGGGFPNPDAGTFGDGTAMGPGAGAQLTTPLSALGGDQPFTDWNQTFQAPTDVTERNDPGYKFRLQQGQQAIENSAAARGGLISGGTAKALGQFSQDYASNEYGNVYNRAIGEYQQGYNIFQNNQATKFNRLSALSGTGQTAATQLGGFGQQAASSIGNIFMGGAQQQGNALQTAAAARASGYVGGANAISGIGNNLSQMYLLSQLLGGSGGGSSTSGGWGAI